MMGNNSWEALIKLRFIESTAAQGCMDLDALVDIAEQTYAKTIATYKSLKGFTRFVFCKKQQDGTFKAGVGIGVPGYERGSMIPDIRQWMIPETVMVFTQADQAMTYLKWMQETFGGEVITALK